MDVEAIESIAMVLYVTIQWYWAHIGSIVMEEGSGAASTRNRKRPGEGRDCLATRAFAGRGSVEAFKSRFEPGRAGGGLRRNRMTAFVLLRCH